MRDCRRAYNQALSAAKEAEWKHFILQLERTSVYNVLDRLRLRPRSVFPSLVDPRSGEVVVDHLERGRVLGRAWFGEKAEELGCGGAGEEDVGSAGVALESGSGGVGEEDEGSAGVAPGMNGEDGGRSAGAAPGTSAETPGSGGQVTDEEWERGRAEMRREMVDRLVVVEERALEAVTDEEVETAVFECGPWKAPDAHGVQMGFIHRGWPVVGGWVRHVFKSSIALGLSPNRLKASDALPTLKPAKKDKTHPNHTGRWNITEKPWRSLWSGWLRGG
ncbi:hypothetical protein C8F04DRAFT_1295210 [Mycena alexandri]|uniref:Uncharacterized protein n=1 Tax=Mycena alexandri TaxID=1745969 RepID=A0AAD6XBG3_9AGAR|nr:hypothetical protein C8F04DRAFT_1295210 [Mycena alexandri]